MDKPKPLRLADACDLGYPLEEDARQAAAELRRLHELHEANEAFGKRQEWWNERMFVLEQQRDALLEVLKYLDKEFRQHGRQHWPEAVRVGAAIKAVEEGK